MKLVRLLVANLAWLSIVTGCSVDVTKDETYPNRRLTSAVDTVGLHGCRFALGRGCLNGHVGAMQGFLVDGHEFFNADDLESRLGELIQVESQGQIVTQGTGGYAMTLITPLDNDSFVSGFRYDLSGQVARSGSVRADGQFSIDDLPAGEYQLRLQRAVRFLLESKLAQNQEPSETPAAKLFCATLYADNTISIRDHQSAWIDLNNFRLHMTAAECARGESQARLHI
ncbi:MAG: hypothetical protein FJ146_11455 [Deltaproteobacteria bacterium]|nr:hypothetical protein [Deltaproteobacteria bacterium]